METGIATTPFGRRPMSLAILAAQNDSNEIPDGKAVDKWQAYRDLCEGKSVAKENLSSASAIVLSLFWRLCCRSIQTTN
jgi:hypothetical protein